MNQMTPIYHITTEAEFVAAKAVGEYYPAKFSEEGFIHCSYLHQVVKVANARFAGLEGLVLIEINPAKLSSKVVDEDLYNAKELFPHIYGPLKLAAVVEVHLFPSGTDGKFNLPRSVKR